MFIPNKTLHAIKVVALIIVTALVMVIAGQSVLYIKMAGENKVVLDSLRTQLDTLTTTSQLFDKSSLGKHTTTDRNMHDVQDAVTVLETKVTELEQSVNLLKMSTDMLIVNECKVMPYYMDKGLMTTCKNKGF